MSGVLVNRGEWTAAEDMSLIVALTLGEGLRGAVRRTGRSRSSCGDRAHALGCYSLAPNGGRLAGHQWHVPVHIYGEGRTCPACGTRLNRYNPGPFCYAHEPEDDE